MRLVYSIPILEAILLTLIVATLSVVSITSEVLTLSVVLASVVPALLLGDVLDRHRSAFSTSSANMEDIWDSGLHITLGCVLTELSEEFGLETLLLHLVEDLDELLGLVLIGAEFGNPRDDWLRLAGRGSLLALRLLGWCLLSLCVNLGRLFLCLLGWLHHRRRFEFSGRDLEVRRSRWNESL